MSISAGDSHYQDRVVRPHELIRDGVPPVVKGFTFDGCHITGPAVLFLTRCNLTNSGFEGDPDGIFIQVVPEQNQLVGVIAFEDCGFDRCRFVGIGIVDKNRDLRTSVETS